MAMAFMNEEQRRMDAIMTIDIILGVLLLLFAIGGLGRGFWAEVVTLVGVLLGALLTGQWADAWGSDLSLMTSLINPATARFIVGILLFLVPLLIIGYAGSLLLPASVGRPNIRMRLLGAFLGLLNGAAIIGFVLRAFQYTYNDANPNSALMISAFGHTLLEWAGWWVLALALGSSIAVVIALLSRNRTRTVSKPAVVTVGPATTKPAPLPSASSTTSVTPIGASRPLSSLDQPATNNSYSYTPNAGSSLTTPATAPSPAATAPTYSSSNRTPESANSQSVTVGPSDPTSVVPIMGAAVTPSSSGTRGSVARRCRTCGKELLPGAAFCTNCGTPVD